MLGNRSTIRRLTAAVPIVLAYVFILQPAHGQGVAFGQDEHSAIANPDVPQVSVVGHGKVDVAPDRATIYFALTVRDSTPVIAASENARRRRQLIEALTPLGIPERAITMWGYGLGEDAPPFQRGPTIRPVTEYAARAGLRVVVNSLSQLDGVIEAGVLAGFADVEMIHFEAENVAEARQVATERAVTQARHDAETLAAAAGGALGELLLVTKSRDYWPDESRMMLSGFRSTSVPLAPSDIAVRVSVQLTWRFEAD